MIRHFESKTGFQSDTSKRGKHSAAVKDSLYVNRVLVVLKMLLDKHYSNAIEQPVLEELLPAIQSISVSPYFAGQSKDLVSTIEHLVCFPHRHPVNLGSAFISDRRVPAAKQISDSKAGQTIRRTNASG